MRRTGRVGKAGPHVAPARWWSVTRRIFVVLALAWLAGGAGLLLAGPAAAQVPPLDAILQDTGGGAASGRIIQMVALITVLSVAPGLLIMMTSFTRFIVAFSFLRSGLGLPSTPANLVLLSLSLFMTFYVMAPTFDRAWEEGVKPLTAREITEEQALERIITPFREFMVTHVRPKDLQLFADLAAANGRTPPNQGVDKVEMRILIPAFMISELRRGFEIGFLIVLPFLIIDMVVATLVMSMGMMMMSPAIISLPFKILFFVLIDGWNLLVGSLVRSYF
ncbi:MAG: flagellar type III secretion system pore protein FliP [Rhizobiales bacterium]|nr:flagellar type III secretion system pore protein FliP [Hyphomicrobiales bacterium]